MATKQVSIPDIGAVTLYKRRGNRSLRLSIGHDGEVRVSMPYWLPYKAGEQFASSKAQWIAAHKTYSRTELQHGQSIGKAHRLYFIQQPSTSRVTTHVGDTEIRIHIPIHAAPGEGPIQRAAEKASVRALRKEAETLLPQRLRTLAQQTRLEYKSVNVKQLKSRWGSCNSAREITLNLFLMQLPWHLIDYVLIHELTHTEVMRHGSSFWQALEQNLPNAKALRKEIGGYQPILSPGALVVA
jgi:predicted metal-dependent hydrolase